MRRDTVTKKNAGRKTVLTETRKEEILRIVRKGNHYSTACAAVGIAQRTLFLWIERGQNCAHAIENGLPHDPKDEPFMQFMQELALARADAEIYAVDAVHKDMGGGYVLSEEPVVDAEGRVQYDENGDVLWKRTYAKPDGRLALAYLSRSSPSTWGEKATRIELVGPDGTLSEGTVQESGDGPTDAAVSLAERLAIVARARAEGEDEVEDPVEGEIVDD